MQIKQNNQTNLKAKNQLEEIKKIRVLIMAAGVGDRFLADAKDYCIPKQYYLLHNKPIIWHTVKAFIDAELLLKEQPIERYAIDDIIIITSKDDGLIDVYQDEICHMSNKIKIKKIGGASRAHSVYNGASYLCSEYLQSSLNQYNTQDINSFLINQWLLVHDVARCMIFPTQIINILNTMVLNSIYSSFIMACPARDTVKLAKIDASNDKIRQQNHNITQNIDAIEAYTIIDKHNEKSLNEVSKNSQNANHFKTQLVEKTLDRDLIYLSQTPQIFHFCSLLYAYYCLHYTSTRNCDDALPCKLILNRQSILYRENININENHSTSNIINLLDLVQFGANYYQNIDDLHGDMQQVTFIDNLSQYTDEAMLMELYGFDTIIIQSASFYNNQKITYFDDLTIANIYLKNTFNQ